MKIRRCFYGFYGLFGGGLKVNTGAALKSVMYHVFGNICETLGVVLGPRAVRFGGAKKNEAELFCFDFLQLEET